MRKARVALTPRTCLLRTTLANGVVVYGENRVGYGGRGVYVFRDAIEPELQALESFLDYGSVLIDIGANTGVYTLTAARIVGKSGLVVAVEPFVEVLATLAKSVRANGYNNVRLRNYCAGATTGSGSLWMNFGKPNSFSLVRNDPRASRLSTMIVTLDDMFAWEGLRRIDYLKIDAEGAEAQILDGGRDVIGRYRPIIQIEASKDEAPLGLPGYLTCRAPRSHNRVFIPENSPRVETARRLGWSVGLSAAPMKHRRTG